MFQNVSRVRPSLSRHYSDDSLHGSVVSSNQLHSSRIHSSADEISSINRSPSISSSDESFWKTDFSRTDLDTPSPERNPSATDLRFQYMFGEPYRAPINVDKQFMDASQLMYTDYLSNFNFSSENNAMNLNDLVSSKYQKRFDPKIKDEDRGEHFVISKYDKGPDNQKYQKITKSSPNYDLYSSNMEKEADVSTKINSSSAKDVHDSYHKRMIENR